MRNLFSEMDRPLPQAVEAALLAHLKGEDPVELTWRPIATPANAAAEPFFTIRVEADDARRRRASYRFWAPDRLSRRGLEALLPARLSLTAHEPGVAAAAEETFPSLKELRDRIGPLAGMIARLMNTLWGVTETREVFLEQAADAGI